jgi:Tfp pilus assembly protein PilV
VHHVERPPHSYTCLAVFSIAQLLATRGSAVAWDLTDGVSRAPRVSQEMCPLVPRSLYHTDTFQAGVTVPELRTQLLPDFTGCVFQTASGDAPDARCSAPNTGALDKDITRSIDTVNTVGDRQPRLRVKTLQVQARLRTAASTMLHALAQPSNMVRRMRANYQQPQVPGRQQDAMWQRNPLGNLSTTAGGTCCTQRSHAGSLACTSTDDSAVDVLQLIRADLAAAAASSEYLSATDLAFARAKAALESSIEMDASGMHTLRAVARLCEKNAQISDAAAQNSCVAALHVCDAWKARFGKQEKNQEGAGTSMETSEEPGSRSLPL